MKNETTFCHRQPLKHKSPISCSYVWMTPRVCCLNSNRKSDMVWHREIIMVLHMQCSVSRKTDKLNNLVLRIFWLYSKYNYTCLRRSPFWWAQCRGLYYITYAKNLRQKYLTRGDSHAVSITVFALSEYSIKILFFVLVLHFSDLYFSQITAAAIKQK